MISIKALTKKRHTSPRYNAATRFTKENLHRGKNRLFVVLNAVFFFSRMGVVMCWLSMGVGRAYWAFGNGNGDIFWGKLRWVFQQISINIIFWLDDTISIHCRLCKKRWPELLSILWMIICWSLMAKVIWRFGIDVKMVSSSALILSNRWVFLICIFDMFFWFNTNLNFF